MKERLARIKTTELRFPTWLNDQSPASARIKWPRMNNEAEWQKLDEDLTTVLEGGLKGNINQRITSFQRIA